jgi:hypothetical protein
VFPIYAGRPVLESDGFESADGLGDIALVSLLSPAKTSGSFLWGVGPTFIFPTASKDELGQEKWQVGMAPNITIDWKADDDNKLTLPVGLGVGKLFKIGGLPLKLILEAQYAVIHPDDFGQGWNIRCTFTPVLPALTKDPIFD